MLFVRIRKFFVRHAFVFKTAVRELYFAKNFVRETIKKFSSYSCCIAKKCSFSRFVAAKNFQNQKSSYFVFVKKLEQQNLRVHALKNKCAQTKKSSFSWFSTNEKSSCSEFSSVSSKLWRKKRHKRLK